MSWRPRLRPEVALEQEEGRARLHDALTGRRVPAGPLSCALAGLMDGRRSLEELLDAATAAAGRPRADAEGALRALLLLGLVEGADEPTAAALRAPRPSEEVAVLPGARFGCAGSGQCCHVFRPGPLEDDDLAALEAARPAIEALLPGLPAEWVSAVEDGEDEAPRRYLARADGRCLFLLPDGRCGVHAAAGAEAKPGFCRLFPFDVVRTAWGSRLFDVGLCSALPTTTRAGPSHAAHAAALAPLLPRRPRLFHPLVLLDASAPCDYGPVRALEERLLERASAPGAAAGPTLLASAALARAFAAALASCPLAPEEPARTAAATLARDRAGETPPLPAFAAEARARALERVTAALEAAAGAPGERDAPLAAAFGEVLAAARSLAAERAGLAAGPLPPALVAAAALPLDHAAADALLASSLRNRLFGARLLVNGRLRAGLLRAALLALLTAVGARLRAAVTGAPRAGPDALAAAHWIAALALDRPAVARALEPVEEDAWAVAAAAADALARP